MEKIVKYQPIELAPEDGSEVVCWCPDIGWRTLCWDVMYLKWVNATDPSFDDYEPTHFIVLENP